MDCLSLVLVANPQMKFSSFTFACRFALAGTIRRALWSHTVPVVSNCDLNSVGRWILRRRPGIREMPRVYAHVDGALPVTKNLPAISDTPYEIALRRVSWRNLRISESQASRHLEIGSHATLTRKIPTSDDRIDFDSISGLQIGNRNTGIRSKSHCKVPRSHPEP